MREYGSNTMRQQAANQSMECQSVRLTKPIEGRVLPRWVPREAQHYLDHTEKGHTIRALARKRGCAPSTILRQVRKIEQKRDDPLIDEALISLKNCLPHLKEPHSANQDASSQEVLHEDIPTINQELAPMSKQFSLDTVPKCSAPNDVVIEREARRILRRLNEAGACLAVAKDMEKAFVIRDLPDGRTLRTAVLDRPVAQALALKNWISAQGKGKVTRYTITSVGRAALKRLLAADESQRAGFSEGPVSFEGAVPVFSAQDSDAQDTDVREAAARAEKSKRVRYNAAESPVLALSRRKDKTGELFLTPELVEAAERLREDFELAQMDMSIPKNWDEYVAGDVKSVESVPLSEFSPAAAQRRVAGALNDLGPGLGDVTLRCCCYLEGMEQAEKRMGWSARSGKIVLRIALMRLKRYYAKAGYSNLIG